MFHKASDRTMKIYSVALFLIVPLILISETVVAQPSQPQQWAKWRGPQGNGIAGDQKPVTTWSDSSNVIWKTKVPGKGHSSPIVTAKKIFLTTSDQEQGTQSVLCFDRDSGDLIWTKPINQGELPENCLLYTSPSPRDATLSRMPSSA